MLNVGEPKTGKGNRKITIAEMLRERKKTALTEWIFPQPLKLEEPTNPQSAYYHMKAILKKERLPSIRFHDLRHTFATMAIPSGVDVKTLSSMLGYYSAGFTQDTYTHITNNMQRGVAEKVGGFMESLTPEPPTPQEQNRCKVIPFEKVG